MAPSVRPGGAVGHLWEQLILPHRLGRRLLFSPANSGPLAIENQVLTIHDTSAFDLPWTYTNAYGRWYRLLHRKLAHRVKHIVTVSEYARNRIISQLRVPPEKISVIYNGVDGKFKPDCREELYDILVNIGIPSRKYIVSVGTIHPCKNHQRLLQAWARAQKGVGPDVWLILVGSGGSSRVFRDPGITSLPERTRFVGQIGRFLPSIYAGAIGCAQVSISESFCLPAVESMACGTPVLVSNSGALPEIVGDAGLFANPMDIDSIEHGILRLVQDQDVRSDLRERGFARAKLFSWDNTARKTWEVIQRVAEN